MVYVWPWLLGRSHSSFMCIVYVICRDIDLTLRNNIIFCWKYVCVWVCVTRSIQLWVGKAMMASALAPIANKPNELTTDEWIKMKYKMCKHSHTHVGKKSNIKVERRRFRRSCESFVSCVSCLCSTYLLNALSRRHHWVRVNLCVCVRLRMYSGARLNPGSICFVSGYRVDRLIAYFSIATRDTYNAAKDMMRVSVVSTLLGFLAVLTARMVVTSPTMATVTAAAAAAAVAKHMAIKMKNFCECVITFCTETEFSASHPLIEWIWKNGFWCAAKMPQVMMVHTVHTHTQKRTHYRSSVFRFHGK